VAIDSTSVFFADDVLGIRRADRTLGDGGSAVTLTEPQGSPTAIAVDDQFAYFGQSASDAGVASLSKVPKGGGAPRVLASGVAPTAIVTDTTCVYYVDGLHVMRVSKGPGMAP
jgi:hypothetical protein